MLPDALVTCVPDCTSEPLPKATAGELRDKVRELIAPAMEMHRSSRAVMEGREYERPVGPSTDDEVSYYLVSNSMLTN